MLYIGPVGNYTLTAGDGLLAGTISSSFMIVPLPPAVVSVNRASPSATLVEGPSVTYTVTFSEPVTNVTPSSFQLTLTGTATAASTVTVSPSAGYSSTYSVTVSNVSGIGVLGLSLVDNGSIVNSYGSCLANAGAIFGAPTFVEAGTGSSTIAAADFNGDGKTDLVVADDGIASVLLGNGDGTFQTPQDFPAATTPLSNGGFLTVGDINGDSIPDLIVSDTSGYAVDVLLGNGDGTFQAPKSTSTAAWPYWPVVADMDGDGMADLVVVNNGANTVGVLHGSGDGTFWTEENFAVGSFPYMASVGDFNGDGKPDVAVVNHSSNNVSVLMGTGAGSLQAQTTYAVGSAPVFVAAADLNGDGKLDLVTANLSSGTVSVLPGNGDGTFQAQKTYAAGNQPDSVAIADVNGDGKLDLVVSDSNWNGSGQVSVLLGNGDGTFGSPQILTGGVEPSYVTVADLNSDGKPDIAISNGEIYGVDISWPITFSRARPTPSIRPRNWPSFARPRAPPWAESSMAPAASRLPWRIQPPRPSASIPRR